MEFRWLGSIPGIFSGEHKLRFLESKTTKGGMMLLHEENFTGLFGFIMGDGCEGVWVGARRRGGGLRRLKCGF